MAGVRQRAGVLASRQGVAKGSIVAAAAGLGQTTPSAYMASADSPTAGAGVGVAKPAISPQSTVWGDIEVGNVVLATIGPDQAWYEAEVI